METTSQYFSNSGLSLDSVCLTRLAIWFFTMSLLATSQAVHISAISLLPSLVMVCPKAPWHPHFPLVNASHTGHLERQGEREDGGLHRIPLKAILGASACKEGLDDRKDLPEGIMWKAEVS